jgi:hypothetical protein
LALSLPISLAGLLSLVNKTPEERRGGVPNMLARAIAVGVWVVAAFFSGLSLAIQPELAKVDADSNKVFITHKTPIVFDVTFLGIG